MTDVVFLVLLILHVGAIVGWMGAAFVFGSVLSPSMKAMTLEARRDFSLNVVPRYLSYVLITSIASIVFGVLLYGYSVMPNSTVSPSTSGLVWIDVGAAIGIIAFILAVGFVLPSGRKLVRFAKDPKTGSLEEAGNVQRRVRIGANAISGLLAIVLILMIIGATI